MLCKSRAVSLRFYKDRRFFLFVIGRGVHIPMINLGKSKKKVKAVLKL